MKSLIFIILFQLNTNGYAAASDKNWFCAQRLVRNISIGAVWHHGHNEIFDSLNQNKIMVSELIKKTGHRLLETQDNQEHATTIVKKFSQKISGDNSKLTLLFAYTLKKLNQQRQEKINYVLNYGRNHQKRVDILQITRKQIRQAIKDTNITKLADLEEQYQWQITVLNARKKHNPYLCEEVVDTDAYAFFLAKEISQYIN
ncbi:hypothetical protein BPUTSESOX_2051 [uncultured Gammaproteobacteria bacterium]|jgi:hemoglobin-like flavoprotein|uniref:hypothetical protein n=1 Tax=thiotrophic endosymbiont of Bathymodiolus puteoserpentis (Logatchev) TaxID=343240 RepID=UPI0010B0D1D5|nr:hypothetical protein [thiotrophic endosymbiont of Bathymodiolus puteoserpentis (Logatchev)]CAC9426858.1 hypothetical protein [uncultured Gammaproteobacteria bacterium]SSC10020.1 hypothetical protein BPUTEOSOX_875 [thiotrophic endosymbiont of Bathymodiolus puteoserpentis (Logatchev)]VVH50717.1 hypothetical protein BPUTSESOX_2051 [uncultured Gammaproteobacteria bacterium]